METKISLFLSTILLGGAMSLGANSIKSAEIPIKRVALFSSGVGFFEHGGTVNGDVKITLPFEKDTLNDVLKSLLIYDEKTSAPLVSYTSEETLSKTLASLKVNLSNDPSMTEILNSLRGAEVEILTPQKIVGRIINAKPKFIVYDGKHLENGALLSIFINNKIQVIDTKEIVSYNFVDVGVSKDLNHALDLILTQRDDKTKNIEIFLPSSSKRDVTLSYVIESPVWKASYRLDLSQNKPMLQGWAIVDNVGNIDWENVELSLVAGRPVSFIQNLYAPYHIQRPNIPLSIAGYAIAETYEGGYADSYKEPALSEVAMKNFAYKKMGGTEKAKSENLAQINQPLYETASAKNTGDMFSFTIKKPITLARQQSAMIPLVNAVLNVKKISIFRGQNAQIGVNTNPSLGAQIINNSGMSLPAGPISIYDGGIYAGDALIEFLNENEKRIISFGDDLSVIGSHSYSTKALVDSVSVNKGVMQISRKTTHTKDYLFKNSASVEKNIVLEHPIVYNSKLTMPEKYSEKTGSVYRFEFSLMPKKEIKYRVNEEIINYESIALLDFNFNTLIYYSKNTEIPKNIQNALLKAVEFKASIDKLSAEIASNNKLKASKLNEQERVRKNIVTVGNESSQGKEYLKKLTSLDKEIEALIEKIEKIEKDLYKEQAAYKDYISSISI